MQAGRLSDWAGRRGPHHDLRHDDSVSKVSRDIRVDDWSGRWTSVRPIYLVHPGRRALAPVSLQGIISSCCYLQAARIVTPHLTTDKLLALQQTR